MIMTHSPVVQSVERRTVNPYVTGSSPVWGAIVILLPPSGVQAHFLLDKRNPLVHNLVFLTIIVLLVNYNLIICRL